MKTTKRNNPEGASTNNDNPAGEPANGTVDILIVDDRVENLLALESVLGDLGQNIIRATSGKQALREVLQRDFAVILLDVQMPDMDGFETATLIRERDRSCRTPIIFLTAISKTEEYVFRGYESGAVDYIFKPFVPSILKAKVMVFVELYMARQAVASTAKQLHAMNLHLEDHARELQVANKELESFSYSVSHDLRAPLRHIDGFVQLLQTRAAGKLDEKESHYLKLITVSVQHMGKLIDDLLHFSRMSRQEMTCIRMDFDYLVRDLASTFTNENPERSIEWNIRPLPQIDADPSLISVAMTNLLSNALKYSQHRLRTKVEIAAIPSGDAKEQTIFVRDNGAGFDMQHVDKLFGVFQRLHRQEEFEGTGIGLAIVHRIISRHGGRVWAEAKVDEGATFFFTLPVRG